MSSRGDTSRHKDRVFISQVFSIEDLRFEEMDEETFRSYIRAIKIGQRNVPEFRASGKREVFREPYGSGSVSGPA